ncbi:MAG: carboxypeptidase-like regulatory domain-containing protein [Candidatus Acidiferrales bacterium]
MNLTKKGSCEKTLGRSYRSSVLAPGNFVWLILSVLLCSFPALAQDQAQSQPPPSALPVQQLPGNISGIAADGTGSAIPGARVKLTREDNSPSQEAVAGDDGRFTFDNIAPGTFQLTIAAAGFATQTFSGTLHPGEICVIPQITLAVATEVTEVRVVVPRVEVAEAEIKEEEKQRVLGFIPNFYVTYDPDAVPLDSKQKFELAWKVTFDPVVFGLNGAIAGIQQAQNAFSGYGQGAEGYGRRYGASYANLVAGTFIGSAILPALLKQDPRYFYKGTGSKRSRILYAIANSVICKGDNGRWQANYSNILGSIAAGGISNLYYPSNDRGAALTFENALISLGETSAANILQEFVIRKLTRNVPNHNPDPPKP